MLRSDFMAETKRLHRFVKGEREEQEGKGPTGECSQILGQGKKQLRRKQRRRKNKNQDSTSRRPKKDSGLSKEGPLARPGLPLQPSLCIHAASPGQHHPMPHEGHLPGSVL